MSIEDRIAKKEDRLAEQRKYINLLKMQGVGGNIIKLFEDYSKEVEKSLEYDKKIQELEIKGSGRKTWKDIPWIYFLVYVAGAITVEIARWILVNIKL
jgi:hypothetical protein